jgi:hypothetical protein
MELISSILRHNYASIPQISSIHCHWDHRCIVHESYEIALNNQIFYGLVLQREAPNEERSSITNRSYSSNCSDRLLFSKD